MPPISLQVGERHFCTSEDTLTGESEYFKALLSGNFSDKQSDGSIFIDRDGDMFVHILRYLRTSTYPLFYDHLKGHDEALYKQVLDEAEYFTMDKLIHYLVNHHYRKVVKCTKRVSLEDFPETTSLSATFRGADGEIVELFPPYRETRKIYICPRGIYSHMDNEDACGKQCRSARGDYPYEDRPEIKIIQVYTRTEIQKEVLNSHHGRQE